MQGFIQRGGLEFPSPSHNFPPPEILKSSMVIVVLSQVLNNNLVPDCIRREDLNFPGEGMPPDPP